MLDCPDFLTQFASMFLKDHWCTTTYVLSMLCEISVQHSLSFVFVVQKLKQAFSEDALIYHFHWCLNSVPKVFCRGRNLTLGCLGSIAGMMVMIVEIDLEPPANFH